MKSFVVAAMLTCALARAEAVETAASQGAAKPVTTFGYLDVDKDARLSEREAQADWAVAQRFASADTNRDGYLDEAEFQRLTRD